MARVHEIKVAPDLELHLTADVQLLAAVVLEVDFYVLVAVFGGEDNEGEVDALLLDRALLHVVLKELEQLDMVLHDLVQLDLLGLLLLLSMADS